MIFTSQPWSEVENLPSVEIDSCGHLLTQYSITLPVSFHPRETQVVTFHVRLVHQERLQIDVAWRHSRYKYIFGFLPSGPHLFNPAIILFLFLPNYTGLSPSYREHGNFFETQNYFQYFNLLCNIPWLAQIVRFLIQFAFRFGAGRKSKKEAS